jgi:hypothetical protein
MQQRWTLILCSAFLFCTLLMQAQQPQVEYRELIVQVPGIVSARGFPDINTKLSAIPGTFIVAFCESQHLVMMKLDRKKIPDNKLIFDAISETGYKFSVKEGATISKAKSECKDKQLRTFSHTDLPSE